MSIVIISCGKDNEPSFPNNNNNNSSTSKHAYLTVNNNSKLITYKLYINDVYTETLVPLSSSEKLKFYEGTYKISVTQSNYIYKDVSTTFHGNFNLEAGVHQKVDIPNLADLKITNTTSDDYYVTIDDGAYEFIINASSYITIKDIDCTMHKIYVVQKNGYTLWPTKNTYYVKVSESEASFSF